MNDAHDHSKLNLVFGEHGIRTVFHPIVDCRTSIAVHGYEALMRGPEGVPFEGPMLAFALAKSMEMLEELDLRFLETAVRTGPDTRLFVNLHPTTLVRLEPQQILRYARETSRSPESIVVEIIEHDAGKETEVVRSARDLRDRGFGIAVDDFGEGSSNLRRLVRIRPDYLKLDRWFIQGCELDRRRRAVIRSAAELGRDMGINVIAEGVSSQEQVEIVMSAGINLVQGWGLTSILGGAGREIDIAPPEPPNLANASLQETIFGRIDDYNERLLDRLPFGVIQLAPDGTVLQYNRYEENLAGFSAAHVVGKNFF